MSTSSNISNAPVRSIAAAATAIVYFERGRIFDRDTDIALGPALSSHGSARSFAKVEVTSTVRNYTLENVLLNADTLLLFQDDRVVPETAYFEPPDAIRYLSTRVEAISVSDHDDLIFGYNNAHRGYQHWLTQCIPAIDWSLRQPRTRDVRLLLPHLEAWQEDFLDILGYGEIPRLTLTQAAHYHLPQVEYSDFLNGSTSFGISLSLLDTAQRILDALPIRQSFENILYIPCSNPYYGSIRNESQVIDLLRNRGVHIVDGDLGTADRINLFRQADVVIGPHGQGLTDVLFCKPGTLLWEWMPRHHQNASFNRLAQAARVDYRGDLFEPAADPEKPGQWDVDVAAVEARLGEISVRLAQRTSGLAAAVDARHDRSDAAGFDGLSLPLDELMIKFESLGDNCEFGLVQRLCDAEPLGLLRFAGFHLPVEVRLQKLVAALERKFEGLGEADTIVAYLDGEPGQREFMVREAAYDLMYHTFIPEGDIDPNALRDAEVKRLGFLRRKLLEDLAAGEKIWVWRSHVTSHIDQVKPLLDVLRRLGANTLLWVVEADDDHAAGTIESLERDFVKGYVRRFAPYTDAPDIHLISWLEVCRRAHEFCNHNRAVAGSEQPRLQQFATGDTTPAAVVGSPFNGLWRWLRGAARTLAGQPPGTRQYSGQSASCAGAD